MVWKFLNLHKLLDVLLEELFDDAWLAPLASGLPDRGGRPQRSKPLSRSPSLGA